ncbi:unnamed protein product [Lota lota]
MGIRGTRVAVFLGNVLLSLFYSSESLQMTVRPDADATVHVRSQGRSPCTLCTGNATLPAACTATSVRLPPGEEATLQFVCSESLAGAYQAQVQRTIACTRDRCSPATGAAQASLLTQLPRTLTWVLEIPEDAMAQLNVLGEGLKEVGEAASCADGFKYALSRRKPDGGTENRTYCHGGATEFTLQGNGSLALILGPGVPAPSLVFSVSVKPLKGPTISVTLDPDVTMVISRGDGGLKCDVCTDKGASCSPTDVSLGKARTAEVEFGCPRPQEVFNVRLQRKIECTETACTPATGKLQPSLLTDFPRTFRWDVSLPERTVLTLDFPAPGLKETTAAAGCRDGHKYSFRTTSRDGTEKETTYCGGGPLARLSFPGKTSLALEVPRGAELGADAFAAKAVPRPGRTMIVTPDPKTRITLSRGGGEPECEVCLDQKCDPKTLVLNGASNVSVLFGCPSPQELYKVEINQEIDCTKTLCSGNRLQAQSTLFPDFNRTFTWDMKVQSTKTVQMDFPEPRLRQVPHRERCPDGHTYSLLTYPRSGVVNIGTYCRGGTLSTVQVRYKARMMLEVPGHLALDPRDFVLSVGPETDALVIVGVDLPRGVSETSFTSANYPGDFPSDQQMTWDVRVPGMHNYTVRFADRSLPEECLAGLVQLRYQGAGGKETLLGLDDPQPQHKQGDFNMSLTNCQPNQTLGGLKLAFTVSVMRSGHPVLCTVDLTKQADLTLQIEKAGSDPYCEMSIDSAVKDKVLVDPGTRAKLSFQDCPSEDLRLTASRVIDCGGPCPVAEGRLTVPPLDACLPMALSSFTWHLLVPENGTLDLRSPSLGGLRQSLPGQECSGLGALRLAEGVSDGGRPIGTFCQQGIVERMQVHGNVSVTVETRGVSRAPGPVLNVSVTEEISEHIIYTVRPQITTPALLATPNWPDGMNPLSTVSWIVQIPPQYLALVQFSNVTRPSCDSEHNGIEVQLIGSKEEVLSRREDEVLEDKLVSENFYINMSSCVPDKGYFSALTKVTLQPKTSPVGIIVGAVGAVLLLVLVSVGVCLFLRKKKKSSKAATEASIYIGTGNGKGNIFRTGDAHFAKARSDNASHVYDSIDDAMVYGHLLRESAYSDDSPDHFAGMPVDTYRTFIGPVDGELGAVVDDDEPRGPSSGGGGGGGGGERFQTFLDPADSFLPPRPRTPLAREESLGYQDYRMVDNALYTFKSTGNFNTIRLSGADQLDDASS